MTKEYGQLTADQFSRLIGTLPELRKQQASLQDLVASVPKERIDELLVSGYNWASVYEFSFYEHLALIIFALNKVDYVKELAASLDPQQKALDDIDKELAGGSDDDDIDHHPWFEKQEVIGLVFSLQKTILSIMLFQQTLSDLVRRVRENNDLDALFNVIRVDRAAVACPSIADRIARAELLNDKNFFLRLKKALKGPSKKHWENYKDLRYSLFALRELGFDKLSDVQLEKLLVHNLKVYPDIPSARKNLRQQYQHSKKLNTI